MIAAISCGIIEQSPCEVCGSDFALAHHDDYNKPLKVRWLCRIHHVEWHRNNKAVELSRELPSMLHWQHKPEFKGWIKRDVVEKLFG